LKETGLLALLSNQMIKMVIGKKEMAGGIKYI